MKMMKRRDFLGKAALGLISTGLSIPLLRSKTGSQEQPHKVIYRTLGRTNLQIPIVSFGVMNSDNPDLIKKALDMGIRHLDTAHFYLDGNSERVIGKVLYENKMREKLCVGTKMSFQKDPKAGQFSSVGKTGYPAPTENNFVKQLETSLQRLRSDYIDILYLHSCATPQMVTYEPLLSALIKAKESGKARFLGISTHANNPQVIRAAVDTGVYDVVLTAYCFLLKRQQDIKKAIKYAAEKGVGIIAMKTQGGSQAKKEYGVNEIDHQAALKWVLNDENVCTAIPGMTAFDQLDANFQIMNDLKLTEKEKRELQLISMLQGTLYCQRCDSCKPTCPYGVEIPDLMRSHMYVREYKNRIQARLTLAELPERYGLSICKNCSSCEAKCPNGIDIDSRLRYLIAENIYEI